MKMHPAPRREALPACIIGLLGAATALTVGFVKDGTPFYVDAGVIAANLLSGKGFSLAFHGPEGPTTAYAPLQPFLLAGIHGVFGFGSLGIAVVRILRGVAHGMGASLAYPIARRLMPGRFALLVCVAIAFHPVLLWFATSPGHLDRRITLSIPLLMLAVWACAVARERCNAKHVFLAGVAIGLGALSEPMLLLFAIPAAMIVAAPAPNLRACVRTVASLALGTMLVLSPWVVRNTIVFRAFVPVRSSFGLLFWVGNNPQATGLWQDQEIMEDPERAPTRRGAVMLGGHSTKFNFRARDTLPPDVIEKLAGWNEVERDRALLPIALAGVAEDPGRFLGLTARRMLYLVSLPPREAANSLGALFERFTVIPRLVPRLSPGNREAAAEIEWFGFRAYLGVSFLLAMIGGFWWRTPTALLLDCMLITWLVVFGVTHCGFPVYRLTLDPLTIIGAAAFVLGSHRAPSKAAESRGRLAPGSLARVAGGHGGPHHR